MPVMGKGEMNALTTTLSFLGFLPWTDVALWGFRHVMALLLRNLGTPDLLKK